MSKQKLQYSEKLRRLTITGMLIAITALLTFTPIGMIPLPPPLLAVTMVHIPVLVAALCEGTLVGVITGFCFGLFSCIRAFQLGASGLTIFFMDPLVSVFPRVVVALVAVGFIWLWRRFVKNDGALEKVGMTIGAVLGSITNTTCCLGMLWLRYGDELNNYINEMVQAGTATEGYANNAGAWLIAVVGVPNGVAEAVVAAIIVPILVVAISKTKKRKRI